jgi:hypothetical protein
MLRRVALVRAFLRSVLRLLVTANVFPSSPILVTLMMEEIHPSETLTLKEPRGVTSHNAAFFIVTAVKTSCLLSGFLSMGLEWYRVHY